MLTENTLKFSLIQTRNHSLVLDSNSSQGIKNIKNIIHVIIFIVSSCVNNDVTADCTEACIFRRHLLLVITFKTCHRIHTHANKLIYRFAFTHTIDRERPQTRVILYLNIHNYTCHPCVNVASGIVNYHKSLCFRNPLCPSRHFRFTSFFFPLPVKRVFYFDDFSRS